MSRYDYENDKARVALRGKIIAEITKHGPNCSLNHLDLTGVRSMDALFEDLDFNGDISDWDVSGVRSMQWLFKDTPFNGDISKWDTRQVWQMSGMFHSCPFTGDISNWNVRNAREKGFMFMNSSFNGDLSKWDMSATTKTFFMFSNSAFNQPIGMWNLQSANHTTQMFANSAFNQDISAWSLPAGTHSNMFLNSKYQGSMPTIAFSRESPPDLILDTAYRGDCQSKYSLDDARALFGTVKQTDAYLQARVDAGYALDRLHIEKIVTSKRKPVWASKELSAWLRSENNMHQTLGLSLQESLVFLERSYREKYQGQTKARVESIAFEFISEPVDAIEPIKL